MGDRYVINSVVRAAEVLKAFSPDKQSYTNGELAAKLGLSKSTVTHLLCSLEKADFLQRDEKSKSYRLTCRLFQIGSVYINQVSLHKEAMPLIVRLSAASGETTHLGILVDYEIVYLDKAESSQSLVMKSRIGSKAPAHCTAMGKVLLAHLPAPQLERYLGTHPLQKYTPKTLTDAGKLKEQLAGILKDGYGIDDTEFEPEIRCAAAPIHDLSGQVVAAISISAPAFRVTRRQMMETLVDPLKETAEQISRRLGDTRESS